MRRHILQLCLSASLIPHSSGQACQQQAKAVGVDTKPGDHFGRAVSSSGDTVVAVSPFEDSAGEDAGAAYVYTRLQANEWRQQAKLVANDTAAKHHFGRSVSLQGDSVVIGTSTWEGAAYVFVRTATNWGDDHFAWTEQQKLEASDKRGGDEFGKSVSIYSDMAVVGAPNGDKARGNFAGAAYVFFRTGTIWRQEAKLSGKDTHSGHYFGYSVAVYETTVAVGTSPSSLGAVYIFTWSRTAKWSQQAKLFRTGSFGGDDFGACLSLYKNTVVIGAPGDDAGLLDAGAAYMFERDDTKWTQTQKVVAADKAEGHKFGSAVSISDHLMAVLATGSQDQSGNYGGSVYVFAKRGTTWYQQTKVVGADTVFGDRFGASVSFAGNYLTVGAPRRVSPLGGNPSGAAYFLKCVTTTTTTTITYTWTKAKQTNPANNAALGRGTVTRAVTSASRSSSAAACILMLLLAAGY